MFRPYVIVFLFGGEMVKKVIWDLDGTLLSADFSGERELFAKYLKGEELERFLENRSNYVNAYEDSCFQYNIRQFSDFLTWQSGSNISETLIKDWIEFCKSIPDTVHDGAAEVLSYLQDKGYQNILYTNWFLTTQEARLRNADLLQYFDELCSGELAIKPNAVGKPSEVIMIGDNIVKDVLVPRSIGITTYHYDPLDKSNDKNKIKTLKKIKEIY